MPREKVTEPTRQLYAQIREDIYLASKAKAAEMRVPLRVFLENALVNALEPATTEPYKEPSVWDDEYIGMQERQPLGSPVELTKEEAVSIIREATRLAEVDEVQEG